MQGVTVGALGRITDRWQILANVGYLDSELNTQNAVNNGNRLMLTPEFSGSIWTTYAAADGSAARRRRPADERCLHQRGQHHQVAWLHARRRAGRVRGEPHLTLRLNIYNLTDEIYIRNVNNNGGRYNPGYPRSAMLTSQFRF